MSTPDQSSKLSSSMKSVKSIESLKSMESVDDNSPYQSNYDHDLDAYIILPNGDKIQRQKVLDINFIHFTICNRTVVKWPTVTGIFNSQFNSLTCTLSDNRR